MLVVATGSAPNFYNVKGTGSAVTSYRISDFERINHELKQLAPDHPSIIVVKTELYSKTAMSLNPTSRYGPAA